MIFTRPLSELINLRYSCRRYQAAPIEEKKRLALEKMIDELTPGPFDGPSRFLLAAISAQSPQSMRGLGTYGQIHGKPGFIIGATRQAEKELEDFGYRMEWLVLSATDLGLGTCWLGGSFTRSGFDREISIAGEEYIPAVISVGNAADGGRLVDSAVRKTIGGTKRLNWEVLFFEKQFGTPLTSQTAGEYTIPLEMVRLGPSASNKQPWRIIKDGDYWHFYLQRTPGYRTSFLQQLLHVKDIQRVDMGIAMSHFELSANESGLKGSWQVSDPDVIRPDDLTEYVVTWHAQ